MVSYDYRVLAIVSFVLGGWLLASILLCLRVGRERPIALVAVLLSFVV